MAIDSVLQLGGLLPRTSNEELFDALVRHQVHLLRSVGDIRNRILPLLDATEKDIADRVRLRVPVQRRHPWTPALL